MTKKKKEIKKKQELCFGWNPSEIDGTEYKFDEVENFPIPTKYSFIDYLPEVENQGNTNMCVTYALTSHLDWNLNVDHGYDNMTKHNIDKNEIYAIRKMPGDNGMTFKEALSYVRKHGVKSDHGNIKIEKYAMVGSEIALKQALLLNGPCIGGMYVKNSDRDEFWLGRSNLGGHAIAIVGWTEEGFIIRNSWGKSWGNNGYAIMKYKDFKCILECWTIID